MYHAGSVLNTNMDYILNGNFRHVKVATVTIETGLSNNGDKYFPLQWYKMFELKWEDFLPKGATPIEIIFSHVTVSGVDGGYATCTPYLRNSTNQQQKMPRKWALWCSSNSYCYPTFFILY